jgi:hypothetical protein
MCVCFKLHLKIKVYTFVASPCALCDHECILDYFKFKTPLSWAVGGGGGRRGGVVVKALCYKLAGCGFHS